MVYEREGFQSMEELDAKVHAVTAEFDAAADLLKIRRPSCVRPKQ